MTLLEFDGLDEFAETLDMMSKVYPKEVKKFMQSEGNKLKKKNKQKASSVVNKKTGNYEKGITFMTAL